MNAASPAKKVFPFRLAPWLTARYASYLRWLKHLLERLGRDCTLAAWQAVYQDYDDPLLLQILTTGWKGVAQDQTLDVEASIAALFSEFFPAPIQGIAPEEARELVEKLSPIRQIRQTFPSVNVWREITAYEALHLRFDGLAILVETLIRNHGKQGELIAYDLTRQERLLAGGGATGSVAEFMADFISQPAEANLFTAGLETEFVYASGAEAARQEVILHVKECAWASYFRERHPQVGYLLACSTDEIAYRSFNENLRLQRTTTLMEGGEVCDFRIYS